MENENTMENKDIIEDENIEARDCNDCCTNKKHGCIINIFCSGKGHNCEKDHKKDDDNCIINIFCGSKKFRDRLSDESLED